MAVTFVEKQPDPNSLYQEHSFVEWLGYWRGLAIGVKKFLFGSAGWAHIVVTTVAVIGFFMSEPVQKPLEDFKTYAIEKVSHGQFLPPQWVTFGTFPPVPEKEKRAPIDNPVHFTPSVVTVAVSGSWHGLPG